MRPSCTGPRSPLWRTIWPTFCTRSRHSHPPRAQLWSLIGPGSGKISPQLPRRWGSEDILNWYLYENMARICNTGNYYLCLDRLRVQQNWADVGEIPASQPQRHGGHVRSARQGTAIILPVNFRNSTLAKRFVIFVRIRIGLFSCFRIWIHIKCLTKF